MPAIMGLLPGTASTVTAADQTIAGVKTFTARARHIFSAANAAWEFGTATDYAYLAARSSGGSYLTHGSELFHSTGAFTARQTSAAAIRPLNGGTGILGYINTGLTPGNTFTATVVFNVVPAGIGGNSTAPTARWFCRAGSATAGTAPIKFQSGTLLATPEAGAAEMNGGSLYYTPSTAREVIFTGLALVSATINPTSTADQRVYESGATAVTAAAVNDPVLVGPPATIEAGLLWCSYVSSAGNVKTRVANMSGGTLDPASATWKITEQH